jgi:hypothetical protein
VSADRLLEAGAPGAEQHERTLDAARESRELGHGGERGTLTDSQLAERIPLALSSFYRHKKLGHFAFLEIRPQLRWSNTRYSADKVARWLRGEPMPDAPTTATRHFFGGGRRTSIEDHSRRARPGRPKGRANQAVPVLAHADRSLAR